MLTVVIAAVALGLGPQSAVQVEPLKFDPVALRALPRQEVRVTEKGERVVYSGVPLRALLSEQLQGGDRMAKLRDLSDAVVLVRASDNYQAALSAAAVAMDETGDAYLLALERDGKPLGEDQGPVKLVIRSDPQPVRWVRMITSVELVRLPRPRAR